MSTIGPNAALHVDWTGSKKPGPPASIYFFKRRQYIRWEVAGERLAEGYPRDIAEGWPGLVDALAGETIAGAMHVPAWGNRIFFFVRGRAEAIAWDVIEHRLIPAPVALADLVPSVLTADGHFAPLHVDYGPVQRVYALRADTYTRFTVSGETPPGKEDDGYPRKIGDGWTGGLTVAPTCAVSVYWTERSAALLRRKIYFFLGDLYTRWDVESHSKNYRLDVPSGWKGWPDFE